VLKINVTETQTENRWILQGQLAGPWVRELRKYWKEKHTTESLKRCIVDLNEVTFIDTSGERLLRAMYKKGADLTADGMYTKHLLETLKTRKSNLPRWLLCLCLGFVTTVVNFPIASYVNADVGQLNTRQDFEARQHFQSRRARTPSTPGHEPQTIVANVIVCLRFPSFERRLIGTAMRKRSGYD
jgi:hypothetical protein